VMRNAHKNVRRALSKTFRANVNALNDLRAHVGRKPVSARQTRRTNWQASSDLGEPPRQRRGGTDWPRPCR
jgi:hypothetical protein